MPSQKLVETALHVLVDWMNGRKPAPAHLAILREAFPASAHLPPDELACQVVHDLGGRVIEEPREERSDHRHMDDVA